jgi:hypothetical protein
VRRRSIEVIWDVDFEKLSNFIIGGGEKGVVGEGMVLGEALPLGEPDVDASFLM